MTVTVDMAMVTVTGGGQAAFAPATGATAAGQTGQPEGEPPAGELAAEEPPPTAPLLAEAGGADAAPAGAEGATAGAEGATGLTVMYFVCVEDDVTVVVGPFPGAPPAGAPDDPAGADGTAATEERVINWVS